ncbi:MAG: lactonase family protein [Oligosphaeraceae bacterium]|nr:lactonase family protein [Oligosphaeraceae bacterium]
MSEHLAFIGTYAGPSYGIPAVSVDGDSGALRLLGINRGIEKPSYLHLSADGRRLYTGVRSPEFAAQGGGGVAAYAIHGSQLQFLNARPAFAGPPCYVKTDRAGKYLYAANYREGSAVVYALQADGSLTGDAIRLQHSGRGPHPSRQESAHIHCTELPPAEDLLYIVDLGLDAVRAYRLPAAGDRALTPVPEADLVEQPGAGPRHLVFSADGHYAYLANELASSVSVWDLHQPHRPRRLQTLPLLPPGYRGENTAAGIKLSPDGRHLCCSNRGHDSLAVFAVDPASGGLSLQAISPVPGRWPRDFAFVPGGRFVLVACQYTDNLLCLRFEAQSGRLSPVEGPFLTLKDQPVCVKFRPE